MTTGKSHRDGRPNRRTSTEPQSIKHDRFNTILSFNALFWPFFYHFDVTDERPNDGFVAPPSRQSYARTQIDTLRYDISCRGIAAISVFTTASPSA
ncbi:hypothetical protein Enr13x_35630 [Stieleria neptunia]|uniref:Uncharacterized protein n=1 Tax=Stieleria neptunia TaxID=2527979 RepID=A0A518HS83_9BACT|nr:hypothetical protein [Stieleria neptunia]QDV43706.1 hypothetical protein Enr13x_35630 [Stieleria neptunia]